jgi:hypothetical protein
MALTRCRQCHGWVNSRAATCPHCDAAGPVVRTRRTATLAFFLLVVSIVGLGFHYSSRSQGDSQGNPTVPARPSPAAVLSPSRPKISLPTVRLPAEPDWRERRKHWEARAKSDPPSPRTGDASTAYVEEMLQKEKKTHADATVKEYDRVIRLLEGMSDSVESELTRLREERNDKLAGK